MKLSTLAFSIALLSCPVFASTKTHGVLDGIPVITSLSLADTPPNAVSRYWFLAGVAQGTIPYYIPVLVARGSNESLDRGKTLSLSSSVHGDELTGIRVIQTVFNELEAFIKSGGKLNGAVVGVPTVNVNGIQHNQRNFWSAEENGFYTNLNRVFPGTAPTDGATFPQGFAYAIWNQLWANASQIDVAVDMRELFLPSKLSNPSNPHADTLTLGMDGPMWLYADYRMPYISRLAQLMQPDIIKVDPGEPGSIETTWVQHGVPAITFELGPPKRWTTALADRAHAGIFRLLKDLYIYPTNGTVKVDLSKTYVADTRVDLHVSVSGFADVKVKYLDDVKINQTLVEVYNSWGDVVEVIKSPYAARVLQSRTDAAVEQGAMVVCLVFNKTTAAA